MTICHIKNCNKEAKGSWLDGHCILTYACKRHFIQYHFATHHEVDQVVKPELLQFRRRELPLLTEVVS